MRTCPALFVSAPASGQGKTTVTAAIARFHHNRGRNVRVFKAGPDFLDPMILERACGNPVYQLDLWMAGEEHCRQLLYDAADSADLILVEGVMGLFDGDPSSADLAARFDIPVAIVIDGSAMAQTFGAVAHGLASYRPDLPIAGVLATRVAGEGHWRMLAESLPPGLACLGWLPENPAIAVPDRHLGLVQASEVEDLDQRIDRAAADLGGFVDPLPAPVAFRAPVEPRQRRLLEGLRIAIARDRAFSFLYRANLDLLRTLGAALEFFSPLEDPELPDADALYLPGGYPELHLARLAANDSMRESVRGHHAAGGTIVAECGGMLYLLESLSDNDGRRGTMAGLLPGTAAVKRELVNLGLHTAPLPEGEIRGHTFHHSVLDCPLEPIAVSRASRHHGRPEPIFRRGRLTASYLHLYLPSNPEASARLFRP